MKPLKVEAVKLYTEVTNRDCLRNGQKDVKRESLESKLQLSLLTRTTQSPNSKFSLQCFAFSLLELTICIETAFYRRDRAEGGAGGALAPPLFCKNKNKLNKK